MMTEVIWYCWFASAIISSTFEIMIGSRPVVGSSNSTTSGFAMSARARLTRFFMPPDRSDGSSRSLPASPRIRISSSDSFPISRRRSSEFSSSGNPTLSSTDSASNSA
jgi:hypothetical protein